MSALQARLYVERVDAQIIHIKESFSIHNRDGKTVFELADAKKMLRWIDTDNRTVFRRHFLEPWPRGAFLRTQVLASSAGAFS